MARIKATPSRIHVADTRRVQPQRQDDPHYQTVEHKQWRDAVIARAGRRCQWPGCGAVGGRMFADHIVELRDGGDPLDLANGQCLCPSHHQFKTARQRAIRMAESHHP